MDQLHALPRVLVFAMATTCMAFVASTRRHVVDPRHPVSAHAILVWLLVMWGPLLTLAVSMPGLRVKPAYRVIDMPGRAERSPACTRSLLGHRRRRGRCRILLVR